MNLDLSNLKKPESKDILGEKEDAEEIIRKNELLTEQIVIKLRSSEKWELKRLAETKGLKLSPLMRSLLKQHGYI